MPDIVSTLATQTGVDVATLQKILGAVLNDPDARTARFGRYGYGDEYYGYGYTAPET